MHSSCGGRISASVYGAVGQIAEFGDSRAADVEEQAEESILDPIEKAMASKAEVCAT